ncbi:uncharacterized protein I206_107522 [Kwoniella pini CBS 10737]|uniref:Uncharacterized protein n=1 Tax=Kwoniella pini CBS 10737 TaxID=1296096 RepID=A0A1B9HXJ3_9TREE|nr:uncharacterized protein I206_05850 [Kwoniella pini CBS 10737]OCF47984.1 hypothetical protein I206_05850 [Kwoniella pini CBS 10737]
MPQTLGQRPASLPRRQTTGQQPPMFMGSGQSSVYLSPIQEARIDSWRKGASEATPPGSTSKSINQNKVKSAPASIDIASSKGSNCTCTCTCTRCGSGGTIEECPTCGGSLTNCSCSIHSPKSKSSHKSRKSNHGQNAHVHGYYSSKRKQNSRKHHNRPEPPLPVSPQSPVNFAVLKAPDKLHLPTESQVRAHQLGVLPPVQWPPAPGQEIPMRPMAKPEKEPPVPRIAGVRDPVSQNYYRQMFPPHGGALPMMIPGIHPIGMVPARPWNA